MCIYEMKLEKKSPFFFMMKFAVVEKSHSHNFTLVFCSVAILSKPRLII